MSNKDKLNIDTLCKEAHKNAKLKVFMKILNLYSLHMKLTLMNIKCS